MAARFLGVHMAVVQVAQVLCHNVSLCVFYNGVVLVGSSSVLHWSCVFRFMLVPVLLVDFGGFSVIFRFSFIQAAPLCRLNG